jgi:hypothetical protein
MLISSLIFEKNVAHLIKKIGVWKNIYCDGCFKHAKRPLKHHQFASSFEQ